MRANRIVSIAAVAAIAIACGGDAPETETPTPVVSKSTPQNTDAPNGSPVIDRITLSPRNPRPGESVRVRLETSDPDGDKITLSYEWRVGGRRVSAAGSSLNVPSVRKNTTIEVAVVASDGVEQSDAARATARVANRAPKITQVVIEPLGSVTVEHDVTASPRSYDPDGDTVEYRYRWRVNGDEVGDEGPVLSRNHFKRGDQIEMTVVASDGTDESEPMVADSIEVTNALPKITSVPGAIDDDGVFRYRITAEDPDNDRLFQYRLIEGPTGMDLDIVSGLLEWAPAEDQAGMHPVKFEIDDRRGGTMYQSFQVEVAFEEQAVPASPAK